MSLYERDWRGARPARERWLAEAGPAAQVFVVSLRRWLDGPEGQAQVWNGLACELGPSRARALLVAFEAFLGALGAALSRRLSRHAAHCPCLGEDEALLAGLVQAAGRGDRETAASRAASIVREADLVVVVERAACLGQLLDAATSEPLSGREARARLH
jgi:hypothetical protein